MTLSLVSNVAILLGMSLLHCLILERWRPPGRAYEFASGLLFGFAVVAGMVVPFHFMPGVIFDGRSVVASVSALMGGPISAACVVTLGTAYRLIMGGAGAWTGVGVLVTSAALGLAYRGLSRRCADRHGWTHLYGLGVVVHLAMLTWMFSLPEGMAWKAIPQVALPVMLVLPLRRPMGKRPSIRRLQCPPWISSSRTC